MHTLSLFPSLLTFGLVAPTLLRLVVSIFILNLGKNRYKSQAKWLSLLYFVTGLCIFVGLFTQVVALVAIAVLKLDFYLDYWKNRKTNPIPKNMLMLYIMAEVILVSLVFSGAGFLAFDWPL